ncbi:hypothetical protein Cgig2_032489 [Carnegiea gigantea]|uniref:Uncharacterized protein n=1 Tax=Carnegiea gigantea TaxID=171969 RepID=A0A9Q1KXT9_9CARY|nr:hypothetical protein Cgig2_032489 [Carnegiea gigantea]
MLLGGVLFCTGAIIDGFAKNVAMLIVDRILPGFGVGFANQVELGWCHGPSLDNGSLVLPDTPNSLIERGMKDEAITRLKKVRGVDDVEEEFNDLVAASEASKKVEHPWRNLLQRKYRPHLTMAIVIPFFQQLTGINVIMFYAPVLFKTIAFKYNASLMSAVITSGVNVLATLVSIYGVDVGEEGSSSWRAAFRCLFVVVAIFTGLKFGVSGNPSIGLTPMVRHSCGALHLHIRFGLCMVMGPIGMAFAYSGSFSSSISVIVMSIFINVFLLETKGVPIEEMSLVWKKHPFWGKYIPHDELSLGATDLEMVKKG